MEAPAIVLFNHFDEKVLPYTGKQDEQSFLNFLITYSNPDIFLFTEVEYPDVFKKKQNSLLLVRGKDDEDESYVEAFAEAAKDHRGKAMFTYLDGTKFEHDEIQHFLNVDDLEVPKLAALNGTSMTVYQFSGTVHDINSDSIANFISEINNGTAMLPLKSAPIPDFNDDNVKVVVGS